MKKIILVLKKPNKIFKNNCDNNAGEKNYPEECLWGYPALCRTLGNNHVDIIDYAPPVYRHTLIGYIHKKLVHVLGDLRIDLAILWRVWKMRKDIGSIFVTSHSAILTFVLLKLLGCRFHVSAILLGWMDIKFPCMNKITKLFWMAALQKIDTIVTLGYEEKDRLKKLGFSNVGLLRFGVDYRFWAPKPKPVNDYVVNDYVFSIGADPNRDFQTLLSINTRIPFIICAPSIRFENLSIPHNVTIVSGNYLAVREWLLNARFVVIPIRDTIRPSGQVCILQAMAAGKAVITTKTRGVWTDKLIDGYNCLLVPAHDSLYLEQTITHLFNNPRLAVAIGRRAREAVITHFNTDIFAASILDITGNLSPH